jgi:hypothetical protein
MVDKKEKVASTASNGSAGGGGGRGGGSSGGGRRNGGSQEKGNANSRNSTRLIVILIQLDLKLQSTIVPSPYSGTAINFEMFCFVARKHLADPAPETQRRMQARSMILKVGCLSGYHNFIFPC